MKTGMKWGMALGLLAVAAFAKAQSPSTVLVVSNANNPQSVALANYYMKARSIPSTNSLILNWTAADSADTCSLAVYNATIAAPIAAKIASLPAIDYIVLCRNLPSKISDTAGSVDSALAGKTINKTFNNYAWSTVPFSSKTYGMYLVTRLDGWSWADAYALVDHSIAAKPGGIFLLDEDPNRGLGSGYGYYNTLMQYAFSALTTTKTPSMLDTSTTFVSISSALGGYVSWGSNDAHFSQTAYNALRFSPGAIAETLVSTSAMYLRTPPTGSAQSQISQLIHNGVTGVKGYVAEPYVDATADPSILFPYYLTGMNLAESFYAASYYVGWKDVVIGDPLCTPYKH